MEKRICPVCGKNMKVEKVIMVFGSDKETWAVTCKCKPFVLFNSEAEAVKYRNSGDEEIKRVRALIFKELGNK
jgi:hypothetical protein